MGIAAAVGWVAETLDGADVRWLLTGGTARALVGAPGAPRDLDIEVALDDVERAADALGTTATATIARRMRSVHGQTAWDGIPVDLSADVVVIAPSRLESDFELQWRFAHRTSLAGTRLRLGPEEEPLVRAAAAGDEHRLRRLGQAAMERGLRADYLLLRLLRSSAAS